MRSHLTFRAGWLVLLVALMGACSAPPRKQADGRELERYMTYAGEPVAGFSLLGGLDNWQSLCKREVGVTSTGSTVSKGLDFVKVREQKCTIAEIRPLDYRRMQEVRRQKATQEKP